MRRSALVLVVALVLAAPLTQVAAQEAGYPGESLLLIMDSSGSMNRLDNEGVALIDGAKQALRVLVSALPEGAHVGLRVYGHRVPNTDKANGCLDTELVIPVSPVDPAAMIAAIDSYEAIGYTPIGLSLQEAVSDLPPAGRRTVVLVSDGVDTCAPPDPCEVAREMAAEGLDLTVHTVGMFLTDPAAEQQLQCIAEVTGGQFSRADSIVDLVSALTGIATQSLSEDQGRVLPVVVGAAERTNAPVLVLRPPADPTGWQEWSTGAVTPISTGETRWFAVDVDDTASWQLLVSANLPWQLEPEEDEYLEVGILDAEGMEVGTAHAILGVFVDAPQRTYLVDAADYGWFGYSVPASSVTDAASAPPAWPGDEAGDPYMARLRDRFLEAGINAGLYELWQREFMGDPLAPGRYFIGITWSAEREGATAMEVNAIVYPSDEAFPARDRPADFILMRGAPVGEPPVAIELSEWNGGALGDAAPRRAAEVWTPIVVDEPISYALWLDQAEVLEVGTLGGSPFRNHGMRLQLHLASETGGVVPEAAEGGDRMFRPGGYGTGSVWEAPASGTYRLTVEARDADPGNTDLAAIVSMFVFGPDPEPPVAAPTTSVPPSTEIGAAEEPGEDEGRGSPLGIVIFGGGAAILLAAASTWWFHRRRKRSA